MPRIGSKTIALCLVKVENLLNERTAELNKAFLNAEGTLKVKLNLAITPDINGNKVVGGIGFVIDEAKGTSTPGWADEDQLSLLDPKPKTPVESRIMRAVPGGWSRGHGRWC